MRIGLVGCGRIAPAHAGPPRHRRSAASPAAPRATASAPSLCLRVGHPAGLRLARRAARLGRVRPGPAGHVARRPPRADPPLLPRGRARDPLRKGPGHERGRGRGDPAPGRRGRCVPHGRPHVPSPPPDPGEQAAAAGGRDRRGDAHRRLLLRQDRGQSRPGQLALQARARRRHDDCQGLLHGRRRALFRRRPSGAGGLAPLDERRRKLRYRPHCDRGL